MLPFLSISSNFLIMDMHSYVDVYAIFGLEPVYCLLLEATKMLKDCNALMLADKNRITSSIRCENGNKRSFWFINGTALSTLNLFLEHCAELLPGYGLKTDFSKARSFHRLTRLFSKIEVYDMLEASDLDSIDYVSSFWVD